MLLWFTLACRPPADPDAVVAPIYPLLSVVEADRAPIRDRVAAEPYATLLARVRARAEAPRRAPVPGEWDHEAWGTNGQIAAAAAFLAWLDGDPAMADVARGILDDLPTDFETNTNWDVNIRMIGVLVGTTDAVDLLVGGGFADADDESRWKAKILEIDRKFFDEYVGVDTTRQLVLGFAQNNHPIRTASAIGYPLLRWPEDDELLDWAASEMGYLLGPDGHYLQPGGGVSEGPFYFGFGFAGALPFLLGHERAFPSGHPHRRDCRNRQQVEPWAGQTCVDGEIFELGRPLDTDLVHDAATWSMALRLPGGQRPPHDDAAFNAFNGGALVGAHHNDGALLWDWANNAVEPFATEWGADLTTRHLAAVGPEALAAATPPSWQTAFFPAGGDAILRSSWGDDAVWVGLIAEYGAARQTLHDHVDGTSFTVAAHGEYLLIDPGYYKPTELSNAETAQGISHNLVLVDGEGPPKKGLLHDFGDVDTFLGATHDGDAVDWAEADTAYGGMALRRATVLVDGRYVVVADRLTAATDHAYAWRAHLNGGYDTGGAIVPIDGGVSVVRAGAGAHVQVAATSPSAWETPAYAAKKAPWVHAFDDERHVGDHAVVDLRTVATSPGYLAVITPWATGATAPLATAIDAGVDATAWRVADGDTVDVLWLRRPGAPTKLVVEGVALETDAEVVVVRIAGPRPFAAMSGGTGVAVNGVPVVSGTGLAVAE